MGIVDHVDDNAIKSTSTMNEPGEVRHRVLTEIMISSRLTQNEDEENDRYYIAMKHVAYGDPEYNLMYSKEGWVWTESDMKTVAEQILQGLQFMHEALIAHRDLKPRVTGILPHKEATLKPMHFIENVLVASLQQRLRVKIADFGVLKILSERGTAMLRTPIGTPGYKAPEVVRS
ncbi:hypothetical protein FHL15_006906 [Xylaria flabelliformis]|uniref:Protein kinase domain-containing protein n=1 Tax=Xylaria flabelliformis TaxID=2512241 RepID=A0A553HWF7_9PEZI|nr:hypothetical protein FHL15_006906 [Xylaria flabelliformis]